jgi:hypothetical protein
MSDPFIDLRGGDAASLVPSGHHLVIAIWAPPQYIAMKWEFATA